MTEGTRRALLAAAGVLAAPAVVVWARVPPLRMRLSSSLPNNPKYASGRTFSDRLQQALAENGLGDRIALQFFRANQLGQEIDVMCAAAVRH